MPMAALLDTGDFIKATAPSAAFEILSFSDESLRLLIKSITEHINSPIPTMNGNSPGELCGARLNLALAS